jgi:uncharacterized protein (TIGR03089 family)
VQLSPPPSTGPPPIDVASGLTAALAARGPGPAITVHRTTRREEQGVASLAQWAAKGAHLLEAELVLSRGDRLHLDVAPGWPLAAVCLAAWWAGVAVDLSADADVAVIQEGRPAPEAADVLWTGNGVDGGPTAPVEGEPWAVAVQSWPDAPPPPQAAPEATALITGDRRWTQAEVLAAGAELGRGRFGVEATDLDPVTAVLALAARPIATPHATVLLVDTSRADADGERVTTWWP